MNIEGMKSRKECDAAAEAIRQARRMAALSAPAPMPSAAADARGRSAPSDDTKSRHSVLTWMPGAAPVRQPSPAPRREKYSAATRSERSMLLTMLTLD